VPRGTANTAERRLSSDCGPATPWWVWGVPHAARARAAQRQTERKHSRLRGAAAGEDRAAAARLGARGRGRAQSLSTFSKLIQSRLYPVCTKHFALARSGSGVDHDPESECSDGTHTTYNPTGPFNISAIQAQIQPFSRLQRRTLIAKRHGTLYFSPPVCPNSLPCT
jgi:hypothetical protein